MCCVRVPVTVYPVNCQCGSRINRDGTIAVRGKPPASLPPEILAARQTACDGCLEYRGTRCVRIDLGCRRTYLSRLYAADPQCPLGRW